MPGWAQSECGCDGVGWPENKSLMHIDALTASCLFSWPEESAKRVQNLVFKSFGVYNIYRLIHTCPETHKLLVIHTFSANINRSLAKNHVG